MPKVMKIANIFINEKLSAAMERLLALIDITLSHLAKKGAAHRNSASNPHTSRSQNRALNATFFQLT